MEPFENRIQAGYVLEDLNIPNLNSSGIEEETVKLALTQPCANGCASRFTPPGWYFSLREEIKRERVSSVVFSSPGKTNSAPGFISLGIETLGPCPIQYSNSSKNKIPSATYPIFFPSLALRLILKIQILNFKKSSVLFLQNKNSSSLSYYSHVLN